MSDPRSALIVDDERDIRELLTLTLGRMGIRIDTAANLGEARELLARNAYDLCFTDMRLPDGNGIELVGEISRQFPKTPVAMITAFGNVELAVEALKAGAFDFVSKPVDINVLRGLVKHALELNNAERPAPAPAPAQHAMRLLGQSPAMAELRDTIAKVARSQAPVYILGESGVGKELVARTIHEQGARASGPFVPVNCGAIPAELMESEFFGHKKGSFTGAHADKQGLFQAASGGTLFLDEVAELPLPMQVKLLRAIQEKAVRPVGASGEIQVDVRILSATHKDLGELAHDGRFRHDLYYRINVIELRVPPLRERTGDLPQLTGAILNRLAGSQGRPAPRLTAAAADALSHYAFPGNVRELENILERAMAMADEDAIDASDLRLPQGERRPAAAAQPPAPSAAPPQDHDPFRPAPAPQFGQGLPPQPGAPASHSPSDAEGPLPSYIEQMERAAIHKALEDNRWNKTKAAAQLGITFRALRYKLKKLGIE
ncbi:MULTISPECIES: sigma-54-dependent transcriptional regulator [Pseudoxanthomonas]|jgi:two-component system response regulator PilR (NtrC family)|uniref:Sigma-54-dependent Fis family transcriptional regulator n=1 Tax=Pseudoxanthomonas winnipegensis TaxID=2480810 RepID=A0A4Q8LG08_9GAMM|nr:MULTISPECIES: sigma-54 dependent transcriptional regulator [Pseudoxanthomonas]PZP59852.1 MAG: sigma-54-dependent Fis family transcriptional regulator [Pseudoxanthomonas spadix]TAA28154.1 sigma-54-dependent Fis family transcriptional regulator [Pseudoxanthomonas winnipegensis]TMN20259.1 sigma-54-dependent Fis family transcriptional regulator [Pseudoxanthomonas sp. X-1]UAY73551.1 sigma-54 dependent transcriptional regulator [Pseudoxanthomonas sp. X-1]